jgi:hypothetical protein
MTKRAKVWLAAGAVMAVAIVLLLPYTMCACTPALNPVAPPSAMMAALDTLAHRQESYYRAHGRYTDTLSRLGVEALFTYWDPRLPVANDRGFDLILTSDSLNCTYLVRRVTDDTTVGRRIRCYAAS